MRDEVTRITTFISRSKIAAAVGRQRGGQFYPVATILLGIAVSCSIAGSRRASAAESTGRAPTSTAAAADPIENLKPGEWYEVPGSHLEAVAASEAKFPWLRGGIYGITACWAGGAFDTQRDRLYLGPGGGHAGYNGNEIYAFDLHDLKWHRLNDPDPVIPGTEYTDLNKAPFAMHTYDGVEYLPPPTDRYVVVGGWGTPRTYALDPDHPEHWEVYADHGTGRTGDICAYDPVSQSLWLSTPTTAGKFSQWDPLTHRWTLRLSSSPDPTYYETADVDAKRRLFVSCGHGKVKTWHLEPAPGGIATNEIKTTDGTEIVSHSSPGFCYVPLIDKFVGWASGPDVYTLDMDTKRWTRHPPAPTNTVTPGPPDQWGTFGRFRYVPSKNVFVVYNSVKQNVFIYRLTADRPNVITGVEATLIRDKVETNLAAAAIAVQARYADGSSKNVTGEASYFSLDPAIAEVNVQGRGVVRGVAQGKARIRAVYSDPAFRRGYSSEVSLDVDDILRDSTLDSMQTSFRRLTIVAGDSYRLETTGSYTRGSDHFSRRTTDETKWTSADPNIASVSGGMVKATGHGGPVAITATCGGKSDTTEVTVIEKPVIQRISFQVQDASPRQGWKAESGQRYSDTRGFGWLNIDGMSTRDDRHSAHEMLLQRFNTVKDKQFKIKVPPGQYLAHISMGDVDYGAVPFEDWVALGGEKLIYYQGHANNSAAKVVQAEDDGLTFTVNGPINYLIVAPVGIDLDKYANDGPIDNGR
jgi:hypothetical protein